MYKIRPVTTADLDPMKAIARICAPFDGVAVEGLDGSVALRLSHDLNDMAVAELDNEIVGFGGLSWPLQDNAWSTQVLVAPHLRRGGIGRALAEFAVERARLKGCALSGTYLSTSPAAAGFVAALQTRPLGEWWFMVADLAEAGDQGSGIRDQAESAPLPDGYAIRHARVGADEELFADVFRATFSQHRFLLPPPAPFVREMWARPDFDPAGVAFATLQGETVGVSAIRGRTEYRGERLASCGHIGPVGVDPAHRQRGLARALLLDNLALARRQGWELASLEVDSINHNAVALYRSLGFEVARRTSWWWRDV